MGLSRRDSAEFREAVKMFYGIESHLSTFGLQILIVPSTAGQELLLETQRSDRRFQFHKSSQLFICTHNQTLFVAAMCVNNPDRVP